MGQGELHHRPITGHGVHHLAGDAVGIQGDPKVQILDGIGLRQILAADGPLTLSSSSTTRATSFPAMASRASWGISVAPFMSTVTVCPLAASASSSAISWPALGIPGAGAGGILGVGIRVGGGIGVGPGHRFPLRCEGGVPVDGDRGASLIPLVVRAAHPALEYITGAGGGGRAGCRSRPR